MAASKTNPIDEALSLGRTPLVFAALFSTVSNLLFLALPLYTQQVFGRVLLSQSTSTLLVLTGGVLFVFLVSSVIDVYRNRVLTSFGAVFDRRVSGQVFAAMFDGAVRRVPTARAQIMRDLDQVRHAISGPAVAVLFDLPFIPLFLAVLFFIDFGVGAVTLLGGLILLGLAVAQDRATRAAYKRSNDEGVQGYNFTEAALRNSEVVRAMGMLPAIGTQWQKQRNRGQTQYLAAAESGNVYGTAIKIVRLFVQILVIAMGAFLIMKQEIPPGLLFANMMIAARAMGPFEKLVGSWNVLVSAQQSYERLKNLFSTYHAEEPVTALPRPRGELKVERVNFTAPGAGRLLLNNVSFEIQPGETLGLVGPSGAGKSMLMRLLVGVWNPMNGSVRLDGADVFAWDRASFGRFVGYLPQDIELFSGTVRDNIARFRPDAKDEEVIEAAKLAGAHEMILHLPRGYDTEIGESGQSLSGGQKQRIGLARALFGDPSYLVLDEPNSNLDTEGEAALAGALDALKARGATVVIASHKPNIFRVADKMLVLKDGRVDMFGPRAEVLGRLIKPAPALADKEAVKAG